MTAYLGRRWYRVAIDEYLRYLALGLANLITILNPDCLVLGGAMSLSLGELLPRLRRYTKAQSVQLAYQPELLQIARLTNDAGIIGAASLCLKK